MIKKISFLLFLTLFLASCSSKYYKNSKNNTTRVTYRGQKPTSDIENQANATIKNKLNDYEKSEEDYHEIPPALAVTTAVTESYIKNYKDISMVEMQRYKIPASITLAQAILESGSGQGRLARHGNNHFGIKCHSSWKGKTLTHDDDEKGECFRRYKYAYESFEDHSAFLVNRSRYASLFNLAPDDYVGWAHGLKKAGYATDPEYAKKLIFLIKKHKLYEYDKEVMKLQGTVEEAVAEKKETKAEVKKEEKVAAISQPAITEPVQTPEAQLPKQVVKNPISEMYVVKAGDTLYKIAREQKIPVEELIKLNNLNEKTSNSLYIGQELRLN